MQRTPVQSSNIASVGYDRAASTLEVEFKNGSVYQYQRVPEIEFRNLLEAASVGAHFNRHIRRRFVETQIR